MSKSVGRSVTRVDAREKATGRARYMDDLCGREALVVNMADKFCATVEVIHLYQTRRLQRWLPAPTRI